MNGSAAPALDALLARVADLPPLPATALALLRLGDAQQVRIEDLARVVQHDPAVTARVLRVANSAFYGVPGGVLTLQDALVVLGSSTLRALALTAAIAPGLPVPRNPAFAPAPFWRTALGCGVLASAFAESARVPADTAFTTGLLHNIGVLAWCSVDPDTLAACSLQASQQETSLHAVSRAALGWDAFQLGECLARRWGLPAVLSSAIGALGQPQCRDHQHSQGALLTVLRVAMVLAEHLTASGVMVLAALTDPDTDAVRRPDTGHDPAGTAPLANHLLHEWLERACPQGSAAQVALQSLALTPSQLLRCLRRAAETAGTVEALVD